MNKFGLAALSVALIAAYPVVAKKRDNLIQPQIVGGQQADEGDYPWMSALVYTGETLSTSLVVGDQNIDSQPFNFSPRGDASGELADCGLGGSVCTDVENKVCLIERGEFNFSEKAENCEAGGGVGVVIYNNEQGSINGTLGEGFGGTIPVLAISQSDGLSLKENSLGETASISISADVAITQDSFCGASFLGDKWVLTAAHCVDEAALGYLKVNVGEHDLSDGADQAITVKRIYVHPDYNDATLENDMALLELEEASDATPIKLASKQLTDESADLGVTSKVMGWGGRIGYAPGQGPTGNFPDVLHEVDLDLMTNQECQTILNESLFNGQGDLSNTGVTDVMICAAIAGGGKSSCQGDSGGPLVIDSNEGWQQVGVVSWGYGCATEGFPGVFARVAEFDQWLTGIYQGIAIDQKIDFHVVPTGYEFTALLTVSNNSSNAAMLSFEVDNSDFTVNDSQCGQLAQGETCELSVSYSVNEPSNDSAEITISPDNTDIVASSAKLTAQAIGQSSTVGNAVGSIANVQWHSGGDNAWVVNTVSGGIESGQITDNQESIAMAVVSGAGEFSFEWGVSSEENTEDPNEPFDTLYLYVNGVLTSYISGEVAFESYSIELTSDINWITWVYSKDPYTTEGEDKGYLRNVAFEPTAEPVTPAPTPTTPSNSSSSSGGSLAWMLALLGVSLMRRKL